jgi:hypothetical protein
MKTSQEEVEGIIGYKFTKKAFGKSVYFIAVQPPVPTNPFIISWTGAPIWSKTNFGPTGHHCTRSSLLPRVCTVPSASAIGSQCFVRVFSTACDSASISSLVSKWRPFSFVSSQGNRKVGWMGTTVMLFLVRNFQVKKEV